MRTLRTPDERFADLPDFDYDPEYAEVPDGDGGSLRMAWVEAGPADGPVVLCLHGEPSWSFLYRTMMPVLAAAGLRVIAPDLVGFGRSDKPAEIGDHTYARHVEWVRALAFDVLDLRGVTLVGQDWGGLIGLRLAAEHPDRFARVVAANTGLPTGDQPMPEVWHRFREPSMQARRASTSAGSCSPAAGAELSPTRCAAATTRRSRTRRYKAGPRAMPGAGARSAPDDPASRRQPGGLAVPDATRDTPFLVAFSDGDPITGAMAPDPAARAARRAAAASIR